MNKLNDANAYPLSNNSSPAASKQVNDEPTGVTTMQAPQITLPKGGGAIQSIDQKFSVNAINGTSSVNIPFPFSPSRNGFMPSLSLSYSSGIGNSPFGLGWGAAPGSIVRQTDKKLPEYRDADGSDIFILSGAEDLVPTLIKDSSGNWINDVSSANGITITRYTPRTEGAFTRIEKIEEADGNTYWKTTTGGDVVSIFGKSKTAQIYDPASPDRIFKWLFEFSYDNMGNCFQYEYKKEDKTNIPSAVHEKNRLNDISAFTNVYLKNIKYANKVHFNVSDINFSDWQNFLDGIDYLLELVMDYGEHDALKPLPTDDKGWPARTDAFSDCRAGFDIRTYRLCRRILMFHNFAELGALPCLVRSLDLDYEAGEAFTFLSSVTAKGYIRQTDGSYSVKALPPSEFTYQKPAWNTDVNTLSTESLENLPVGIDNAAYQFTDLYNEGISGILTEQAGNWYYKSNMGNGKFNPAELVTSRPSATGLSSGALQLQDLEAQGQQFLVSMDLHGYFELDDDNQWLPFKTFDDVPNINLHDPNLKFLDLNGDGRLDILISGDEVFTWYASKGKEGFEASRDIRKEIDEERGPNIVFADSTQSIALADMNGDGKKDIVRIRCNEVVYWPNLGYGKFGAKVTLGSTQAFDIPENFNPHYIKLADIDGSGTNDIIYLGHNSFKVYFNQAGNSLSEQNIVNGVNPLPFPQIDGYSNISIIDLLGNGTGCIVWSSPLPGHADAPLRYIDLMAGKKPYLMTATRNNMGAETSILYQPSTAYYLQDKQAGTPWVTKLPFAVQCVSKVEVADDISKTRFTSQYTYHHGYYDHLEREFRGFGRVEQTDTEDFEAYRKNTDPNGGIQLVDEHFFQPPVLTKTWFHTGAFMDKEKILNQFAHEYFQNASVPEKTVEDPPLPATLTIDEWRQALRACKGMPLRVEVYTPDGSEVQHIPYTTANHSCLIKFHQPQLQNQYAVFSVHQSESLAYSYERNAADPRIAHTITLEADDLGNVLKAATVTYGRKIADPGLTADEQARQAKTHIACSQNNFTNSINTADAYHLPLPFETMSWELTGFTPATGGYFTIDELKVGFDSAAVIAFEVPPSAGIKQKRLLTQNRSLFLKNDLGGPLALGAIESLALPYQSYKLALTPGLRDNIFGGKVTDDMLLTEGKYAHFNDGNYWIASGTHTMDPLNFYQVTVATDPFGINTTIGYDANYHFFVQQTIDALGNQGGVAGFNYRTLSPYLIYDINDNRSGVRTDELGMVTASFVMGKEGENKGDMMDITKTEASVNDKPGSTLEYNLDVYRTAGKPNFSKATVQETHYFDSQASGVPSLIQVSYSYMTGTGGVIMQKKQAEPGIALQENEDGTVVPVDTTPNLRWIGNGRTILNNKGMPVKQYEPYFSTTPDFEDSKLLVERGVTPVITYDSAGRAIRTDFPNGTLSKVEFDAWMQRSFDENDTVLESQWYAERKIAPVAGIATPEEIAAADKAAAHADTPAITYLDSLGGAFLGVADNGTAGKYKTSTETDIKGNALKVSDARGNIVEQYTYDMLGAKLYILTMDAGERWSVSDVMGRPMRAFDSRAHVFRYEYDKLHRPLKVFMKDGTAAEINTEKTIYGEGVTNDKALNMRGKAYQSFDSASLSTCVKFDFKGNLLQASQQLCSDYKANIDWSANPALQTTVYNSSSMFDALNRAVTVISPENSVYTPTYNQAGLLNTVDVNLRGESVKTSFVKDINYDEKGRQESIVYGNNTKTSYRYQPDTSRLSQILTTGKNGTDLLQKLSYTYDPVGNISAIKDEAQQTAFFNNGVVSPSADFVYDALYRLLKATGREHIGQSLPTTNDDSNINLPQPGDGAAMRNYTQSYRYDEVGNILQMIHTAGTAGWTRNYQHETTNNRLKSNTLSNSTEAFTYDAHGNIENLAQLRGLTWNYKDELQMADLGGGGKAYYVYAGGNRVRKVIERLDGAKEDRTYLGGLEIYRKTNSAGVVQEETETLHVTALVETKTIKSGAAVSERLIRYQYSNHQGSSSLELDANAAIISYEEYYPYGSTAYQAINAQITAAAKRYRYTGLERDDETGLEYHGARYYLPWLGRWLSADPVGIKGGLNVYRYCKGSPVRFVDLTGKSPEETIIVQSRSGLRKAINTAFRIWTLIVSIETDKDIHVPKLNKQLIALSESEAERKSKLKASENKKYLDNERKYPPPPPPNPENPPGPKGGTSETVQGEQYTHGGGNTHEGGNVLGTEGSAQHVLEEATHIPGVTTTEAVGGGIKAALKDGTKGLAKKGLSTAWNIIEGLRPDPIDAIILTIQTLGAGAEAIDLKKANRSAAGFAAGLSANLLGKSEQWKEDHLALNGINPSLQDRIIGAEGVDEKAFNQGLRLGYNFANGLTQEQRIDVLNSSTISLSLKQGYTITGGHSIEDVWKVASTLITVSGNIINQKAEDVRRRRQDATDLKNSQELQKRFDAGTAKPY
ncbi:MAG: SpvB/TcaC N-terminal domain-containing protein [Bacteroidota bacterium]